MCMCIGVSCEWVCEYGSMWWAVDGYLCMLVLGRVLDRFVHMDVCDWLQMGMFLCVYWGGF